MALMLPVRQFILKVASRCNLNCSYCYMYNLADRSYRNLPVRVMSGETAYMVGYRIQEHALTHGFSDVDIVLHGGEPLLVGRERLSALLKTLRATMSTTNIRVSLQTNGTLLDDGWLSMLEAYSVVLGISMDGLPESHDKNRVDHRGRGSYDRVRRALTLVTNWKAAEQLFGGVLCVIDPGSDPAEVYQHFRSIGIEQMDFLLPDASHDAPPASSAENPIFGRWLADAFDAWLEEDNPNVRVRLFESLISAVLGAPGETDALGGNPLQYLVIETDGSYGALDVLRAVADGIVGTGLNVYEHAVDCLGDIPVIQEMQRGSEQLCAECNQCKHRNECGGGYFPHRYKSGSGFRNPSAYCIDLAYLCEHIKSAVQLATMAS